jgi:hypothetical protein
VYAFEYRDQPGAEMIGPMAQDVEEKYPGTTYRDDDDVLTIDYKILAARLCV